jgi:hypothetical protein
MSENLGALAKKLQQSKERELQELKQIESEKLSELSLSLRESLKRELSMLEADMIARLKNLQIKMSEARQMVLKDEKATLKTLKKNRAEIEEETLSLLQAVNKIQMRYWVVPLIVGLALTLGLAIGLWGLGAVISDRNQALIQLNEQIEESKASFKMRGIGVDGDYIILPKGWRAQTGFESKSEKREAIKMIRER